MNPGAEMIAEMHFTAEGLQVCGLQLFGSLKPNPHGLG